MLVQVEASGLVSGQELFISPDVASSASAGWLGLWGSLKSDWSWSHYLRIWELLGWVSNACGTVWSSLLVEGTGLANTILGDVFYHWLASWLGACPSASADSLVEWAVQASTVSADSLSDVTSVWSTSEASSLSSLIGWAIDA